MRFSVCVESYSGPAPGSYPDMVGFQLPIGAPILFPLGL